MDRRLVVRRGGLGCLGRRGRLGRLVRFPPSESESGALGV